MEVAQIYILFSLVALVIVAIIVLFVRKDKKEKELSQLAILALVFVLLGVVFGEYILIGYSLMGVGVLLAIIDIFIKAKKKRR
jgi:heme A synthase